ncbi:MAG: cytochrome c biogenesis protein CcsA [Chloroflexi bacterium]|nr:cytochrome c biogenesis protein CcsA [Chloroflexota bacterium]
MSTPAVATFALALALIFSLFSTAGGVLGHLRGVGELRLSALRASLATTALLTFSALILWGLLLTHRFDVAFVAQVSSREMSIRALLSSFWGGQAGSLLFRTLVLSWIAAAVIWVQRRRETANLGLILAVVSLVEAFFILVLLVSANPFVVLPTTPADGQGLNPLLQDEAMSLHPPLLLSGYMAFTIPFAIAVAGLLSGEMGTLWLRSLRRWTLVAWTIQGCGLLAGAWWAYHVLGWGGYWGWDPVENVALLPWLVATALLHSLMVQERRGMLRVWNVVLATAGFSLAIFGMFIVGSGVITSVHSFAESSVGPLFFGFLGLLLLCVVALIGYRLPQLRSRGHFDSLASRESSFLLNNVLLASSIVAIFWGTVFPIVSEVLQGVKIGVGAHFYTQVDTPIFVALILLMGVGPLLAWRRTSPARFWRVFGIPLLAGGVVWALLLVLGMPRGLAPLAYSACTVTFLATLIEMFRGVLVRKRSGASLDKAVKELLVKERRRFAGYLVHLAVLVLAIGVIGSTFQVSAERELVPGQALTVGPYQLQYIGTGTYQGTDYVAHVAALQVRRGSTLLGVVQPEKRVYVHWEQQPVSGVSILTTWPWLDDVYVLVTSMNPNQSIDVRVFINPQVSLIWMGAVLFAVGVVLLGWPQEPRPRLFSTSIERRSVASET